MAYNFTKISATPVVDEMPENSYALIESEGKLMRTNAVKSSGGSAEPTLIIKMTYEEQSIPLPSSTPMPEPTLSSLSTKASTAGLDASALFASATAVKATSSSNTTTTDLTELLSEFDMNMTWAELKAYLDAGIFPAIRVVFKFVPSSSKANTYTFYSDKFVDDFGYCAVTGASMSGVHAICFSVDMSNQGYNGGLSSAMTFVGATNGVNSQTAVIQWEQQKPEQE